MQQKPILPSQPTYPIPQVILQPPHGKIPKWRALHAAATLLKALGWLLLLLSILAAILFIVAGIFTSPIPIPTLGLGAPIFSCIIFAAISLLGGGLFFLILSAYAEFILVLISIERNTRNRW